MNSHIAPGAAHFYKSNTMGYMPDRIKIERFSIQMVGYSGSVSSVN